MRHVAAEHQRVADIKLLVNNIIYSYILGDSLHEYNP